MIAQIKGIVDIIDNNYLIVDVNGVGYKILVSNSFLSNLHVGDSIKLFTYTHVREDILELFGFSEYKELKLFELLISVSGVGPKTALSIFSVGSYGTIINALTIGDTAFFTTVPRLGTKNAQRIIIDLKGKLSSSAEFNVNSVIVSENREISEALKTFGFTVKEIQEAVKNINLEGLKTEEKIKLVLKELGK